MTAKQSAIQDIRDDLRQQGKCFIAFHRELDPIMSYLVSEQIHQQYNLKHKKHV